MATILVPIPRELLGRPYVFVRMAMDGDVTSPKDNSVDNPSPEERDNGVISQRDEEWVDILGSGHIKKKVLVAGPSPHRPERSDICTIDYCCSLEDDTVVESVKDLRIHLGDLEVVHGLDLAIALMDVGETAEVLIRPRFGYGTAGLTPNIPPNADIKYSVTLKNVTPEPHIKDLSVTERVANGCRMKERGNWWYAREEYTFAIQCYRRAIEYLDESDITPDADKETLKQLLEDQLKTYNNLTAAQMKVKAYDGALISVSHVLRCQPENVKALFRKSKILKEKGSIVASIAVLRQALSVEPESNLLNQELSTLLALQKKDDSDQRILYRKMLGQGDHRSSLSPPPTDKSGDNPKPTPPFQTSTWRWLAVVSFAAAIIGAFAVKYKF